MKKFPLIRLFPAVTIIAATSIVYADTTDVEDLIELDPYVVTANRTLVERVNVSQSIDVLTGDDVIKMVGAYTTDYLKKMASVDVIEYPGGTSGVSIRGFRPEYSNETNPHTLILVNGRPVSASLGNIAASNVERIEVLKGPASAMYGPSAMAGVINIITKQSDGAIAGNAYVSYGSYDEAKAGFSIGGAINEKMNFDVAIDFTDRGDDYEFGDANEYELNANGSDTYEHTQFTRVDGRARLGYKFNSIWSADLSYDFSIQNNIGVPGPVSKQKYGKANYSNRDTERYDMGLVVKGEYEKHVITNQLYYNYLDALQTYADDTYSSYYRGRTNDTEITEYGLQVQDFWKITENNDLTYGIDINKQEEDYLSKNKDGSVRSYYTPNSTRTKTGVYAESINRFAQDKIIVNFGARYDNIETKVESSTYEGTSYVYEGGKVSFDQVSPRAGIVYKFSSSWRLHASIGTAFIAPDARELAGFYTYEYSHYTKASYGNADLDPESSVTYDLGLEYAGKLFTADITLFSTDVDDQISNVNTGKLDELGRRIYTYVNADSQEMQGVELTGTFDLGKALGTKAGIWTTRANWTYIDKAETYYEDEVTPVKNIAKWKGNFSLNYNDIKLWSRLSARYNGHRWDIDYTYDDYYGGDWYEFEDYWVFDWSIGYKFLNNHQISLTVGNLMDKYYYEKLDYPMEGRNFTLKYEYSF